MKTNKKALIGLLVLFLKSIAAGGMIAIGSAIYLKSNDKTIGAFMFSIGLISIIILGYKLFTGMVGYAKTFADWISIPIVIIGNFIGSALCIPFGRCDAAIALWERKLDKPLWEVLWQSILCGMLVYVAVESYKQLSKSHNGGGVIVVVLAVSGFIVAGGEHSIADMCYMFAANGLFTETLKSIAFLATVIIGNMIGARVMGCNWGVNYLNELYKN